MTPDEQSELLREWALEEGFDRAGIARLEPSRHGDSLRRWLDRGEHAGMGYLNRRLEVRLDPRRILPGARSAICVALCYQPLAGSPEPEGDLWPWVARYAHGDDYHEVMESRLGSLAARVENAFPGTVTRAYVDTGPVLERELAARAGIGVAGKNTNLLHPDSGSWFLIGELFLTLALLPDPPLSDLCGTCTRCLDECPTQAFPEPYCLDSNKCISYWTIEHRGVIPQEVCSTLGEWVFGCDVCQEVCPVGAVDNEWQNDELRLPPKRSALTLVDLLLMERKQYVEVFRGSAMKRAKLEGLKRNVAVAMGNRGDARYVEPLCRVLEEPSSMVRGQAAWALARIGGDRSVKALERAVAREGDPSLRSELESALATLA